jgi:hypothetical protein
MLDDATTGGSTPAPRCNWCSAPLPSDHETVCPSCGATLLGDGDTSVPGLTAIDAEAILRNARAAKSKPRSRLLGWISGDFEDDSAGTTAAPGSLAPPPANVRREMLRLELEAHVANAQAEVEAMAADAAVEEGRSLAPADDSADAEPQTAEPATAAAAAEPEPADAAEVVAADAEPDADDGATPAKRADEAPPA